MSWRLTASLALSLAACQAPHLDRSSRHPAAPASAAAAVAWQPYAAGLAQAKAQRKPMLLVIGASWCPHCRNYTKVFLDPRVIAAAKDFVMVRIDEDVQPAVAALYRRDGAYVPRTYFLAPDGAVADVHAENPRYRYFYDERDPRSILAGMAEALRLTGRGRGE